MAKIKTFDFDTLSNHAGQRPDKETGARAVPIYQTASYVFRDSDAGAAIFNIERGGHVYSRISNPTNAVLEERISALEGGVGAVATSSGQAAVFNTIATLVDQGGHIVSSYALYGGTHNLMEYTLPRFGITTTFVDPNDIEGFKKAIKPLLETHHKKALILGTGGASKAIAFAFKKLKIEYDFVSRNPNSSYFRAIIHYVQEKILRIIAKLITCRTKDPDFFISRT